jgi:hypothetical protein
MNRSWTLPVVFLFLSRIGASAAAEAPNLIENPSFTDGTAHWSPLWTREAGKGRAGIVSDAHSGPAALRIEHTGAQDWSFAPDRRIPVLPREIYQYSAWVKTEGVAISVQLNVTTYDRYGNPMDWAFSEA